MHSQISTLHLIKRFVPYFKKYKGVLFLDLFCAALTTVCELVFPLIVRYITDMGMNHLESLTVQIILTLGGFYLVLRLIDTAATIIWLTSATLWAQRSRRTCVRICSLICRSSLIPIMTKPKSDS